jgi:hypothetical protein
MKNEKKRTENLERAIAALAKIPNIWSATSVGSEPTKWLHSWQVFKAVEAKIQPEVFGYHFVGYDIHGGHGAVSSKIESFDPVKMCGITRSGRVYQLVGMPGMDPDAEYTLNGWAAGNQVIVKDATDEFIEHYKINLGQVRAADQPK